MTIWIIIIIIIKNHWASASTRKQLLQLAQPAWFGALVQSVSSIFTVSSLAMLIRSPFLDAVSPIRLVCALLPSNSFHANLSSLAATATSSPISRSASFTSKTVACHSVLHNLTAMELAEIGKNYQEKRKNVTKQNLNQTRKAWQRPECSPPGANASANRKVYWTEVHQMFYQT